MLLRAVNICWHILYLYIANCQFTWLKIRLKLDMSLRGRQTDANARFSDVDIWKDSILGEIGCQKKRRWPVWVFWLLSVLGWWERLEIFRAYSYFPGHVFTKRLPLQFTRVDQIFIIHFYILYLMAMKLSYFRRHTVLENLDKLMPYENLWNLESQLIQIILAKYCSID